MITGACPTGEIHVETSKTSVRADPSTCSAQGTLRVSKHRRAEALIQLSQFPAGALPNRFTLPEPATDRDTFASRL